MPHIKTITIGLILLICLSVSASALATEANETNVSTPDLTLHRAYPVEGPRNCQPSGLTIWKDDLYTVSDKHDNWVYRIELKGNTAALTPARKIRMPIWSKLSSLDFEGISHDENGNFYLASEAKCRVLRVPENGEAEWVTPDLKPAGRKNGLFNVENAHLEAISCISPHRFVLCAERQPRGFLEINFPGQPPRIAAYPYNQSIYPFARGRSLDFSGLYWYHKQLYVLERNAFLISALKQVNGRLAESRGWSYRHIVTSTPYRYEDMRYGKAEGLCIDDKFVYIILDNNGGGFAHDPDDRRPLLMVFNLPDNMGPLNDY